MLIIIFILYIFRCFQNGETEVTKNDVATTVKQNIVFFDIAMDDSSFMKELSGIDLTKS